MAALEEGNAARKIGALAAQSAARAQGGAAPGFREIRKADRVSLPGPTAAGIAMQLSRDPSLQARFQRLQQETAGVLNEASVQGRDLSTLRTTLPAVMGRREFKPDQTR